MQTLITIGSKTAGNPPTSYTLAQLNRMAKAAVGKQGTLFAVTINFDEHTGTSRLIASYATGPNAQTFTTVAI